MPTAYVKKMADKHGISVGAAEEKWERAKEAAEKKFKHGSKRFWPYVVGIFKRMFGEAEEVTFKDFMLLEADGPSIPKGVATLPKRIMVGTGGYYLELKSVKPIKATFVVKRLLGEAPGMEITISKRNVLARLGVKFMLQAHGEPVHPLSWADRSLLGTFDEVKPFDYQSIRQFARGVIEKAGLDKLAEDKKEDGVKKSYLDFKGSSKKKELKKEMKREIKRFSKLSHKSKEAYPDDWTADQKYKAELKKKGKKLPKSEHTKEFERRYGK